MSVAFISYAQYDQAVVKRIVLDLKKEGIQVWFDQQEILVGDSILERIRDGIRFPISELPESEKFKNLKSPGKRFIDSIKMIAFEQRQHWQL